MFICINIESVSNIEITMKFILFAFEISSLRNARRCRTVTQQYRFASLIQIASNYSSTTTILRKDLIPNALYALSFAYFVCMRNLTTSDSNNNESSLFD